MSPTPPPTPPPGELIALLLANSEPEPNSGCRLWLGHVLPDGYGRVFFRGEALRAHRAAYEAFIGPIPAGLFACHRCDVRSCIEPLHLYAGTHADNMRDMTVRGRRVIPDGGAFNRQKTHCPQGHAYEPGNTGRRRGRRACKACERRAWTNRRRRNRALRRAQQLERASA